jgi:hypothetical protein
MRSITALVWIPVWSRRGFRNLLKMADDRAGSAPASV